MNFKRILSLLLCIVLLLGCVMPLASCRKDDDDDDGSTPGGTVVGGTDNGTTPGKTNYTVQVKTAGGMPLAGVMVYVLKGEGDFDLATLPKETDANGVATFELDTSDKYTVRLDGVPKGYTTTARYPMSTTGAAITVASAPIATGGFASSYELGDVMYDFTLTDVEGNSYKLSELLETKRMVMINFWYVGCSNCAYEFPYINDVYDAYSDKLEILAVNDYTTDTVDDVKGYGEDVLGIEGGLKMPLIKVGNSSDDLTLSKFPSEGYPTTVIIDRYGVIAMIEVGALLGENKWMSIFNHFTADNYEQKLIENASELTPRIEPTKQWTDSSASEIAGAFNSGDISVTYRPETDSADAKYAWPFITATFGEGDGAIECIKPSNYHIDNSFSILYADVQLKPGQAVVFDYYASTQQGYDVLYVLVDGKDIYSISGDSADEGWSTCCTYVDPRPVLDSNKDEVKTYEIAFAYYKDDFDNYGEDTVYLKDLRVISVDDIEVETYIFRYAATDKNSAGDGYNTYVEIYVDDNGYYRVGKKDDKNGQNDPLLLANLLGYTNFDSSKTVSQRVYENYELLVDGVNMFDQWLIYGNAASNSQIINYTAVTPALAEMLQAYCLTYCSKVGKSDKMNGEINPNLWLQLCAYYDAYGKDEDGNPAEQLENPIKGLTDFSAFDVEMKEDAVYESGNVIASGEVTYNRVIMPRGYLYKFVPTVSGVYRITSKSDQEVNGWIFIGDSDEWAANGGDKTILTHYDTGERYSEDMFIESDGKFERDFINTTLVAYLEAGTPYYIDLAYYDVYATGTFTFDVKWVGESFGYFIQASPGPITYIEGIGGSMGQLIAGGITPLFANAAVCPSCGELVGFTDAAASVKCVNCANEFVPSTAEIKAKKYAFELKGYDENNDPILGMVIYADFNQPTTLFPSQSIEALIIANAFNFTVTATDREALQIIDEIRIDGKAVYIKSLVDTRLVGAMDKAAADADAKWIALGMDAALEDIADGEYTGEYTEEVKNAVEEVLNGGEEGKQKLLTKWTNEFYKEAETAANANAEAKWNELGMTEVMRYAWKNATVDTANYTVTVDLSGGAYSAEQEALANQVIADGIAALKAEWGNSFVSNWNDYELTDIIDNCLETGIFHNTDNRTDKDIKAQGYLAICNSEENKDKLDADGRNTVLMEYWDVEFDSVTPPVSDENDTRSASERRYDFFWDYYQMDDVKEEKYHGKVVNYTDTINGYVAEMENDMTYVERYGCVAVTEELAEILQNLVHEQVFEDVQNGWLKFCYYYNILGA